MVDGRWQAGKVTIDLNVGRSSRSLLIHSSLHYSPHSHSPQPRRASDPTTDGSVVRRAPGAGFRVANGPDDKGRVARGEG